MPYPGAIPIEESKLNRFGDAPVSTIETNRFGGIPVDSSTPLSGNIQPPTQSNPQFKYIKSLPKQRTYAETVVGDTEDVTPLARKQMASSPPLFVADNFVSDIGKAVEKASIESDYYMQKSRGISPDGIAQAKKRAEDYDKANPIQSHGAIGDAIISVAGMLPDLGQAAVRGMASGSTAGAISLATVPPTAAATVPLATFGGALKYWYDLSKGQLMDEMEKQDVSPDVAQWSASFAAMPYSLLMMSQLKRIAPSVLGDIKKTIAETAIKDFAGLAKQYGKDYAVVMTDQAAMSATQSATNHTAIAIDNALNDRGLKQPELAQDIDNLLLSLSGSALPMALMLSPVMAKGAYGLHADRVRQSQFESAIQQAQQAADAYFAKGQELSPAVAENIKANTGMSDEQAATIAGLKSNPKETEARIEALPLDQKIDLADAENVQSLEQAIDAIPETFGRPINDVKAQVVEAHKEIATDFPPEGVIRGEPQPNTQWDLSNTTTQSKVYPKETYPGAGELASRFDILHTAENLIWKNTPEGERRFHIRTAEGVDFGHYTEAEFKRVMKERGAKEVIPIDAEGNRSKNPKDTTAFVVSEKPVPQGIIPKYAVKSLIRRNTGQVDLSSKRTMTERKMLDVLLSGVESASKRAYKLGRKQGIIEEGMSWEESITKAEILKDLKERWDAAVNGINKIRKLIEPHSGKKNIMGEYSRIIEDLFTGGNRTQGIDTKALSNHKQEDIFNLSLAVIDKAKGTESLPPDVVADLQRMALRPIKTLSLEAVEALQKTAQIIYNAGVERRHLFEKTRKGWTEQAIDEAVNQLGYPTHYALTPQSYDTRSKREIAKDFVKGVQNDAATEAQRMDAGKEHGFFQDRIYGEMVKGEDVALKTEHASLDRLANYISERREWFDKWRKGTRKFSGVVHARDGSDHIIEYEITNGQALEIYMQSFNEKGYANMTDLNGGIYLEGHYRDGAIRVEPEFLDSLSKSMGKEEKDFARFIWNDINGDLFTEIQKVFKTLHGYEVPGENFYLSMKAERPGLNDAQLLAEHQGYIKDAYGNGEWASVDHGMLNSRVNTPHPIVIGDVLGTTVRHINKASKYIGLEKPLYFANRILRDELAKKSIVRNYGEGAFDFWDKWLHDIASASNDPSETIFNALRRNISTYQLIGRIGSPLQQFDALVLATRWLDWRDIGAGLRQYLSSPVAIEKEWRERIPILEQRRRHGYHLDAADIKNVNNLEKFIRGERNMLFIPHSEAELKEVLMSPFFAMDTIGNAIVAEATRQRINRLHADKPLEVRDKMMNDMTEMIVRKSQSAATALDAPAILRQKGMWKELAMWFSSTGKIYNVYRGILNDKTISASKKAALLGNLLFWSQVVNIVSGTGVDALGRLLMGDDKKKKRPAWYLGMMGQVASGLASSIVGLRSIVSWLVYKHLYGSQTAVPNLTPSITEPMNMASNIDKQLSYGNYPQAVIETLNAYTGIRYGIPTKRLLKSVGIDFGKKADKPKKSKKTIILN